MNDKFLEGFYPYQQRWLLDESRFKIGLWARQTGKDYTCTAEAVYDCMHYPQRHWLILACGERQALESLEKAKEWARRIKVISEERIGRELPGMKISSTEIRWEGGSRITALPANPETVRGYSANVILTEFAFHEDPQAVWAAIFPSATNPLRGGEKKLRVISTPNGQGNFFHQLWTNSQLFKRFRTTIHDAIKDGLPLNLPTLKEGIQSAELWAQEYECQFLDGTAVLMPYELIESCEASEATEAGNLEELTRHRGDLFVGIDFGRKQDLTVCWVLERLNGELWTREVLVLERMPTPQQMEALAPRVALARRVCVDYTGAGIGLGDLLTERFGRGRLELCTFTAALKEEIFSKLRAAFERRKIWIPQSARIREDLHSMHRVISAHGAISYRASHTADGHSDRCTALSLALRAAECAPVGACAASVGSGYRMGVSRL